MVAQKYTEIHRNIVGVNTDLYAECLLLRKLRQLLLTTVRPEKVVIMCHCR